MRPGTEDSHSPLESMKKMVGTRMDGFQGQEKAGWVPRSDSGAGRRTTVPDLLLRKQRGSRPQWSRPPPLTAYCYLCAVRGSPRQGPHPGTSQKQTGMFLASYDWHLASGTVPRHERHPPHTIFK